MNAFIASLRARNYGIPEFENRQARMTKCGGLEWLVPELCLIVDAYAALTPIPDGFGYHEVGWWCTPAGDDGDMRVWFSADRLDFMALVAKDRDIYMVLVKRPGAAGHDACYHKNQWMRLVGDARVQDPTGLLSVPLQLDTQGPHPLALSDAYLAALRAAVLSHSQ